MIDTVHWDWGREARLKGLQEGEASLLARQLTRRFGHLPDSVRLRLAGASLQELDTWGLRLLEARTLDEVFGDAA